MKVLVWAGNVLGVVLLVGVCVADHFDARRRARG
jgi:hypothetical protein